MMARQNQNRFNVTKQNRFNVTKSVNNKKEEKT